MFKFCKLLLIFTLGLFIQINSMEPQKSQTAKCSQEQNKQEFSDQISLQNLPIELQMHILQYIAQAKSASSVTEIFKNLASVSGVNKDFYSLIYDKAFLKTIGKDYFSDKTTVKNELVSAILNKNLLLTKFMLSIGLDPNIKNEDGNTALIYAAANGYTDIVNILLAANANPNIQNNKGKTALICASKNGHIDIVQALLDANADPNIRNNDGNTALIMAFWKRHNNIVKVLLKNSKTNSNIKKAKCILF